MGKKSGMETDGDVAGAGVAAERSDTLCAELAIG
jgi:hypothetical protein